MAEFETTPDFSSQGQFPGAAGSQPQPTQANGQPTPNEGPSGYSSFKPIPEQTPKPEQGRLSGVRQNGNDIRRSQADYDNMHEELDASDSQSKMAVRGPRDPESSSEKGSNIPFLGKTISDHSKPLATFMFPTAFKFNVEYSSDEIFRLLRREEVQTGLRPKFMKELNTQQADPSQNICIRCRTCNAYVDFKPLNGKYTLAVLRNKHTHQKDSRRPVEKEELEKKKEMAPMLPKSIPQNNISTANHFITNSSIKTEAREGGSSSLKDLLEKLRTNVPLAPNVQKFPRDIQPVAANRSEMPSSYMHSQPSRAAINKFKIVEDFLLAESHSLVVEQGREPPGSYPEIMVMVSPTMKRNFARFGDLVNFHIAEQPILETSETGHNFRMGVFTVYGYNRKMLIAGVTFLCRETAAATRTVFEFFLKIHNKQPESISTTHSKEVCLALNQLQDEGIYKGIHVIDPRYAIQSLENGLKVRNKLTREIIELCNKVVSERSKIVADKFIRDIEELIEAQDEQIQKVTQDFLNQKEKICISSQPPAFLGIGNPTNNTNKIFDELLHRKTNSQGKPMTIESLCRHIVALDNELLDQSFEKLVVYQDPIEQIFEDQRIKHVRESIDTEVFKIFVQNYIEAKCYTRVRSTTEEGIEIENTVSGQNYNLSNWNCSCDEKQRTGLPCSHLLCVALETPGMSYFQLISKRWREHEETEESDESHDLDEADMDNYGNEPQQLRESEMKPGSPMKGSKAGPAPGQEAHPIPVESSEMQVEAPLEEGAGDIDNRTSMLD